MGIAAITLTGLIGLLASTLRLSGESTDRFSTARIFQAIGHEAQMKDWSEVLAIPIDQSEIRYFNEKGEKVEKTNLEAIYAARITYRDAPLLAGQVAQKVKTDSRRVVIEVSAQAQKSDPFKERLAVRKLSILLTRLDK
jgi:uncharacterized protein (TIGR02598 family)